jgi:serine/threonine protein kinase
MDRINQWEKRDKKWIHNLFDFQGKNEKLFLAERLTVAYDIASALSYLHDLNIIYRDLKVRVGM